MKKCKHKGNKMLPHYQDGGYSYDDAMYNMPDKKRRTNTSLNNILGYAGGIGGGLYGIANQPGQDSDVGLSELGMGLQGASAGAAFGPLGAVLGGIGGAGLGFITAKGRNIEREEAENMLQKAYMANATVGTNKGIFADGGSIHIKDKNKGKFTASAKKAGYGVQEFAAHVLANKDQYSPLMVKRANFAKVFGGRNYEEGGKVNKDFKETDTYYSQVIKDKDNYVIPQMFGNLDMGKGGVPLVHIQTEDGEMAVLPDGAILDVKAKKKHKDMKSGDVTDILPADVSYIASAKPSKAISKTKAEKTVLGHTPVVYNEFENEGEPEEITLADLYKKEEHTPAELAKILKDKFKTSKNRNDVFLNATNDENRIGRLPYLSKIISLSEGYKSQIEDSDENIESKKWGGKVKGKKIDKYEDKGVVDLENIYKTYGDKLTEFNNKYQQEYSDYYRNARGKNALANVAGIVGTGLQSSYVNPGLGTNRYADQMFQTVPNFIRESNKQESLNPIYAIARNQGVLNLPSSTAMSRISPLVGNAIGQVNETNRRFALDDVNQSRNKSKFLQELENQNLQKLANAENTTTRMDNYKTAQTAGFIGRGLTQDATLQGKELATKMGLERNAIDAPFQTASQLAQYRMLQEQMNKLRGNQGSDVSSIYNDLGSTVSSPNSVFRKFQPEPTFDPLDSSLLGKKKLGQYLFNR